jgi:hypothetical protein
MRKAVNFLAWRGFKHPVHAFLLGCHVDGCENSIIIFFKYLQNFQNGRKQNRYITRFF